MTIIDDWCPTCEESCSGHPTICTTCGSALQSRPSSSRTDRISTRAVPEHLVNDLREASASLSNLLSGLRGRVADLREQAIRIQEAAGTFQDLPAEAMDPQQATSRSRPTAQATLESLPRIMIESRTALLQSVNIKLQANGGQALAMGAVVGEFGPAPPHIFNGAKLVVASPKTGLGGLTEQTKKAMSKSCILYMQRGDGVTFVKKAMMGQEEGASAIIIGNNTSPTWPYVMTDSRREADILGLNIPVVMVKHSDGQDLVRFCSSHVSVSCDLDIQRSVKECTICLQPLGVGQKVLQIPACGHIFHEKCALTWLSQHNSCPYCRRELPTDDEAYETERRRTQRTHAGSERTNNQSDEFYG